MTLEKINLNHIEEINKCKEEYDKLNEDYNGAFFIKDLVNEDTIKLLDDNSNGINLPNGYVPGTCFVAKENNKIVEFASLRHVLNDYLLKFGGHIGYSVIPSERKKGYGTKILKELLIVCKNMNINKVLITCNSTNKGSMKVIEKDNGILENTIKHDNITTYRYWIDIK